MKVRTRAFLTLMLTVFSYQFANGISRAIQNNFYVEDLHLGADEMGFSAMIVPILGGMPWARFGFQVPFLVGAGFIALSILVTQRIPPRAVERPAAEAA